MLLRARLTDGTVVGNTWLWANAHKMRPEDVSLVLSTPKWNNLANAMLAGFADCLRRCYKRRWCAALNRKVNAWRDTPQSTKSFEKAARTLAEEHARRGLTADLYMDAAIEMRPKAVSFPTPQMLAGALADAIRNWIPREQRQPDQDWSSYEDPDGLRWLSLPDNGGPVLFVNSPAARAALLKSAKVQ